jgi:predicted esterase
VNRALDNNYRAEAERRGYIVVMPAAFGGRLFTSGAGVIFPTFLDQVLKDYKIQNSKFHVAGASNGGNSALYVAARYPEYVASVTGFPGYLPETDELALGNLKSLCLFLHVGELDDEWLRAMKTQAEFLRKNGLRVRFTVEPGQPHGIRTLAGAGAKRLFDQFEQATAGCN